MQQIDARAPGVRKAWGERKSPGVPRSQTGDKLLPERPWRRGEGRQRQGSLLPGGRTLPAGASHLAAGGPPGARGMRRGAGQGHSPWVLGGFLFLAIFGPAPPPDPRARVLWLPRGSASWTPGFRASCRRRAGLSELFVAVTASARRPWRPGLRVGAARLPASPPIARPRMPPAAVHPRGWRGQRGSPERPPRADLPLPARALPTPHPAVPSEPPAPIPPGTAPSACSRGWGGRGWRRWWGAAAES